jgi:hypothetical protein
MKSHDIPQRVRDPDEKEPMRDIQASLGTGTAGLAGRERDSDTDMYYNIQRLSEA